MTRPAQSSDGAIERLLDRLYTYQGVLGCWNAPIEGGPEPIGPPAERFAARDADLLEAAVAELAALRERAGRMEKALREARRIADEAGDSEGDPRYNDVIAAIDAALKENA